MCSAYTARHGTNEMINTQTRIKVMRYECIRCAQLSSVFISQRERAQGLTHDLCAKQVAARRKCIIYLCSARIATQVTRFSFKIIVARSPPVCLPRRRYCIIKVAGSGHLPMKDFSAAAAALIFFKQNIICAPRFCKISSLRLQIFSFISRIWLLALGVCGKVSSPTIVC